MIPSGVAGQPADSRTGAAGGLVRDFTGGFLGEAASSYFETGEVNREHTAAPGGIEGAIGSVAGGVGGATGAKFTHLRACQVGCFTARSPSRFAGPSTIHHLHRPLQPEDSSLPCDEAA